MMDYKALTDAVMTAYGQYLYAITGVYLSMQAPGTQVSPRLMREFESIAHKLRGTFMQSVNASLASFQPNQVGSDDYESVSADVNRIASSNIRSLRDRMAGQGQALAGMLKGATGGIGQLLQRKLEKPEFKTVDASGRSWKSDALMRTVVRDYGYQASIEAELAGMESDLAQVVYADPSHANCGLVFSISGKTAGYPSFAEIRSTIFHPNATAQVTEYVPA